jgi:hypothetical protein
MRINGLKARLFAAETGRHLITWQPIISVRSEKGAPPARLSHADKVAMLAADEFLLTGYFVEGAPARMLQNLSVALGLVNGADVTLHSLSLSSSLTQLELGEISRQLACPIRPGALSIIRLPHPPEYVNVLVSGEAARRVPDCCSIAPPAIVIPIAVSKKGEEVTLSRAPCFGIQKRITLMTHDVSLAWSITDFKVQGRTIPNLVVWVDK